MGKGSDILYRCHNLMMTSVILFYGRGSISQKQAEVAECGDKHDKMAISEDYYVYGGQREASTNYVPAAWEVCIAFSRDQQIARPKPLVHEEACTNIVILRKPQLYSTQGTVSQAYRTDS